MPIENRDLAPGTVLQGRYKRQEYKCVVEQGEGDHRAYVLEDGRRFKSPSAAASAVMGGNAANGWVFWSVEGTEASAATESTPAKSKTEKTKSLIRRTPNQRGVSEGQTRYFCDPCMKSFLADGETPPEACPQGHRADDQQVAVAGGA